MNNLSEASSSYERCLVYETLPSDLNRVYTRMALVYLEQKKVLLSLFLKLDYSLFIIPEEFQE